MIAHSDLVKKGERWVRSQGYSLVFTECGINEKPDVIGFNTGQSLVVECKVSVLDFKRDCLKAHRHTDTPSLKY